MNYTRGISYEEIKKPDIESRFKKQEPVVKDAFIETTGGMNFNAFKDISIPYTASETETKKSKPRKSSSVKVDMTAETKEENKGYYSATEPYIDKYKETNTLLKTAIAQLDMGLGDMQQDLIAIRSNKTLRNKYQQMGTLQENMGSYLGTKISAIKELNNVISKCNDLELKRAKELKELDNVDDDKKLMDMYNAFISMPQNPAYGSPLGPTSFDMTHAINNDNINISYASSDSGYDSYIQNKTAAQNMMSISDNPNVKQVVVHDSNSGQTYFEMMDMTTMQPVPNSEKYDNSFLEDTHLDFVNNIATNVNIGESYPIIQVGSNIILNEY